MKKRQSTVQKFSTFLSFLDAERFTPNWIVEPELERTIRQQVQKHPEKTAEVWALHFLAVLRSESKGDRGSEAQELSVDTSTSASSSTPQLSTSEHLIAKKYLSAYLQEACYQAARKIQKQFRSVQYKYALEDLFQIGNLLANQPAKLFRSFKPEYQYTNLESYARTAIFRFIGNTIYTQDIEAKREKFSDYGLLRDLSNKELKEALASQGVNTNHIDLYTLARHCFNAVCQPQVRQGNRSLEAPSQEDLVQIAIYYNQQHSQLAWSTELADAIKIQEMLSTCIQAARNYRTQRVLTLEDDTTISDPMPTPWDTAIQIEEREQVESLVSELFTTIPEAGQTLLKLWLSLNLTQAEIATVLKHKYPELQKQYQVARHLGKYNRNFLKEFLQQCQRFNPSLSLQDDKAIELIQESLDQCLRSHCERLMSAYLEHFAQQYCDEDEFLLLADSIRNKQLGQQQADLAIGGFIQAFQAQLEEDLNLPRESLRFVNKKIAIVVGEWLH